MFRDYRSVSIHIICLTIILSVLSPCTNYTVSATSRKVSVVYNSIVSDQPSTIVTRNTLGKNKRNSAVRIDTLHYSETYLTYRISGGKPYQFYVISAWIKAKDFQLQKNSGYGISIMVNDPSDYNCKYVYSDMIYENTKRISGNENGWVQLRRVVKLDSHGKLIFNIRLGWTQNKSKGTILIDQVKVTPIKEDTDYRLYSSKDGAIRMVFKKTDIDRSGITSRRINDWLDVYAKLRKSMKWLVGDTEPYEGTTDYILTEDLSHYGLAGNPIYINSADVSSELGKIELNATSEGNNILWGFVHEMGHTFDGVASNRMEMRWVFDAEFFATFKCVYSLYDNGYGLGGDSFTGEKVYLHFQKAIPLSSGVYDYEGFMYRLMEIMDTVDNDGGWEALHKTFISFNQLPVGNVPQTNIDRFKLFIQLLSENSGIDIEKQFTQKEWNVLINKFTYDGFDYRNLESA